METEPFAVFILTHGRAHNQKTMRTLRRQGYTGAIYLLVDNEDKDEPEYRRLYGDQVLVFDKQAIAERIDEGDNFHDRRSVVYARVACWESARACGLTTFLQLDDDYDWIRYQFAADLSYLTSQLLVKDLDRLFQTMRQYYRTIPALTLAMGQTGDLIGGQYAQLAQQVGLKRKAMNAFLCHVERPIPFRARVNEDVATYVTLGHQGVLFLTFFNVVLHQERTQQSAGGMSDLYESEGSYVKSFYPILFAPSCVRLRRMGPLYPRIHHAVLWNQAVPKILREDQRHRVSSPSMAQ